MKVPEIEEFMAFPAKQAMFRPPGMAIGPLRTRIKATRPTYHVFSYRDRNIFYDLVSGATLELDLPAFLLLRGIEEDLPDEEIEIALVGAGFLFENIPDLVAEVGKLAEVGLFQLEELDSKEERDDTVKSLQAHHPRKMMLLVQTSCNLRCNYCYEVLSSFHQTGNRMSFETAKQAVEHLIRKSGARRNLTITFFGGEPLLNFPVIRQTVEYCTRRGKETRKAFDYTITTNGTLLTDEVIEFLVAEKIVVMLSLDGPPEKNDIHRVDHAGRGAGERTIANAAKLLDAQRKAGVRLASVRATMTSENHDLNELGEYFASLGFQKIMLGASAGTAFEKNASDITGASLRDLQARNEIMLDCYLDAVAQGRPLPAGQSFSQELLKVHEALANPRRRGGVIGCGIARNMQAITQDGRIFPCHRYAGVNAFQLGNLEQGLIRETVDGYYRKILDGYDRHCSNCWARFQCGGQCPWYLSKPDGLVTTPDEESCDAIRLRTEQLIWLYHELRERHPRSLRWILFGEKRTSKTGEEDDET